MSERGATAVTRVMSPNGIESANWGKFGRGFEFRSVLTWYPPPNSVDYEKQKVLNTRVRFWSVRHNLVLAVDCASVGHVWSAAGRALPILPAAADSTRFLRVMGGL